MSDKETSYSSFMEKMFSNIGGKIKGLAKVIFIAGVILSIILGIVFIADNAKNSERYYNYITGYYYTRTSINGGMVALGIGLIFVGFLLSWVGTVVLYGFGQLVGNYSILAKRKEECSAQPKEKQSDNSEVIKVEEGTLEIDKPEQEG